MIFKKKKFSAYFLVGMVLALAAAVLFSLGPTPVVNAATCPPGIYGDANNNSRLDCQDPPIIIQAYVNNAPYSCLNDYNKDGFVTAQDALGVVGHLGGCTPPSTPTWTKNPPATGYPGEYYTFEVRATDPDGDKVKYYFDWGDKTSNTTALSPSGRSRSAYHSWALTGVYTILVYAIDEKDVWSTNPLSTSIKLSCQSDYCEYKNKCYVTGQSHPVNQNEICKDGKWVSTLCNSGYFWDGLSLSCLPTCVTAAGPERAGAKCDYNPDFCYVRNSEGDRYCLVYTLQRYCVSFDSCLSLGGVSNSANSDGCFDSLSANATNIICGTYYCRAKYGVSSGYKYCQRCSAGYTWNGNNCVASSPCAAGQCLSGSSCYNNGVCHPTTASQKCSSGSWVSSCGDGTCNCGENAALCNPDCNTAPIQPSWIGTPPSIGNAGKNYSFTAQSTDPDGHKINYLFDWGDGTIYTSPQVSSGTSQTGTYKWSSAGLFTVSVYAYDQYYLISSPRTTIIKICAAGSCDYGGNCYSSGVCHPTTASQKCSSGSWVSSCGDGTCNCGETSATCSTDCVTPMPDMIIQDFYINPSSPFQGQFVNIIAGVKNQGNASAGSQSWVYYYYNGAYQQKERINNLAPGTTQYGSGVNWLCQGSGFTVKAAADGGGEITESNEGNNEKSQTITCASSPPPPPPSNNPPTASISPKYPSGDVPLTVKFSLDGTDSDGFIDSWNLNCGQGTTYSGAGDPNGLTRDCKYTAVNIYSATLTVVDDDGAINKDIATVNATPAPFCGDGNVDPGEDCDPPGSTCPLGTICTNECQCPWFLPQWKEVIPK